MNFPTGPNLIMAMEESAKIYEDIVRPEQLAETAQPAMEHFAQLHQQVRKQEEEWRNNAIESISHFERAFADLRDRHQEWESQLLVVEEEEPYTQGNPPAEQMDTVDEQRNQEENNDPLGSQSRSGQQQEPNPFARPASVTLIYSDNEMRVNTDFIEVLTKLPVMPERARAADIGMVRDNLQQVLQVADDMRMPTCYLEPLILARFGSLLNAEMNRLWTFERRMRHGATMALFREFLATTQEQQLEQQASRNQPSSSAALHVQGTPTSPAMHRGRTMQRQAAHSNASTPMGSRSSTPMGSRPTTPVGSRDKCAYCDGPHKMIRCQPFKDIELVSRIQFVNTRRLCQNCFSNAHRADNCPNGPCFKCFTKHNSVLCPVPKARNN